MIRKNENSVMGGVPYAAPAVTVVDVHNEGLLCVSGDYFFGGGGIYGDDDINDNGSY